MKYFSNDCVGCPPEMGCLGDACKYAHAAHWACDRCGAETPRSELRVTKDGEQLCEECLCEWAMETLPEPEGD